MAGRNTRMTPNEVPIEELRAAVHHDPETGKFTWRHRACVREVTNKRFADKPAFITNTNGYRAATIRGTRILAHRAMWALVHGEWPKHEIDHINGDRADNRISNLRAVSFAENHKNTKMKSTNTTGYNGVAYIKGTGRWRARAKVDGKNIHIGVFPCITSAAVARKQADARLGFHSNHGRKA